MIIADMPALAVYLSDAQLRREVYVKCEFTPALSARLNDAALLEALVTGLPMAQGVQHRILRSRGRGVVLTARVRYREGVRMLDHRRQGGIPVLTDEELSGLADACEIALDTNLKGDEESRFCQVYSWICRNIRYVNTAPGKLGYEQLVGAVGVLKGKQANCQGFADLLYLLCGLCGIACEYRCARGERRLHVWNAVCLNGLWREVDASKGARVVMN